MSAIIQTQLGIVHLNSGLNSSSAFQRTANESAFTSSSITVATADETLNLGDIITPQQVFLKLVSGDDLKIGFADGVYPMRLSGNGDVTNLRLDVEGLKETSTITTIADSNSSLSGKYFDLTDINGTARIWFDMAATIASGSITYGTPAVAVAATGTLTLSANPSNNETVTIGATTYTFKTTLSVSPTANEVLIGSNASDTIDNLINAVNDSGIGEGSQYGSGTTANASASAAAGAGDTMVLTALVAGYNVSIATTETLVNGSFGVATLTGGLNRTSVLVNGSTFSYVTSSPGASEFSSISELNTLVNALANITSTTNGTVISIVADVAGAAGNAITLVRGVNTAGTLSVSGATLTGGTDVSTAPATPGGGRLIPVTIVENASATTNATAIAASLDADYDFDAEALGSLVTVTDSNTGTRTIISAGNSGMTVARTQAGSASPVVHLRSTGTSQVVVAIAPA